MKNAFIILCILFMALGTTVPFWIAGIKSSSMDMLGVALLLTCLWLALLIPPKRWRRP